MFKDMPRPEEITNYDPYLNLLPEYKNEEETDNRQENKYSFTL